MKQYSRFISLAGGILAFFSLALPWESNYSGLQLANGIGGITTIVLIVSLAIICINIYLIFTKPRSHVYGITIALIVGLIGVYGSIVAFLDNSDVNINHVTIALIASLLIIGTTIYMLNRQTRWKSLPTLWVIISSVVGLYCFFVFMFGAILNIEPNGVQIDSVKYGTSLTAVGFILAIVGVLCFPSTENESEKDKKQDTEEISAEEE